MTNPTLDLLTKTFSDYLKIVESINVSDVDSSRITISLLSDLSLDEVDNLDLGEVIPNSSDRQFILRSFDGYYNLTQILDVTNPTDVIHVFDGDSTHYPSLESYLFNSILLDLTLVAENSLSQS